MFSSGVRSSAVSPTYPPLSLPPPPPVVNHAATGTSSVWVGLTSWTQGAGLAAPVLVATGAGPVWTLSSADGILELRAGSQIARWSGIEVYLGFAPRLINGQLYVHSLDLRKTVQPLLGEPPSAPVEEHPIIVLDPGHGGENAGARSVLGGHYEKEFTLDWALRLRKLLADRGCEVFLTREDDSDMALSNRVAFAVAHRANAFLSLHFNSAAPNESEAGLETYCLTPEGMPSTLTRGFSDDPALAYANNTFDTENLALAVRVQEGLLQVNGHKDRGVRHARFLGVLRGQQCAAVLVEGGYLSNPEEAGLIAQPEYREKLAEAVASALLGEGNSTGTHSPLSSLHAAQTNAAASQPLQSLANP